MTCHPTDSNNPVPPGCPSVPEGATTVECCGALILQQRELHRYQEIMLANDRLSGPATMRKYRQQHPRGMTRSGLSRMIERALFGGTPLDSREMTRPDLNEPGIGHPDLVAWKPVRE